MEYESDSEEGYIPQLPLSAYQSSSALLNYFGVNNQPQHIPSTNFAMNQPLNQQLNQYSNQQLNNNNNNNNNFQSMSQPAFLPTLPQSMIPEEESDQEEGEFTESFQEKGLSDYDNSIGGSLEQMTQNIQSIDVWRNLLVKAYHTLSPYFQQEDYQQIKNEYINGVFEGFKNWKTVHDELTGPLDSGAPLATALFLYDKFKDYVNNGFQNMGSFPNSIHVFF